MNLVDLIRLITADLMSELSVTLLYHSFVVTWLLITNITLIFPNVLFVISKSFCFALM